MNSPSPILSNRDSFHRLLLKTPYVLAALVAGLTSVGFGILIDRTTEQIAAWLAWKPFIFLALTPCAFVTARWIVNILGPASAGSGIPQVIASLRLQQV